MSLAVAHLFCQRGGPEAHKHHDPDIPSCNFMSEMSTTNYLLSFGFSKVIATKMIFRQTFLFVHF